MTTSTLARVARCYAALGSLFVYGCATQNGKAQFDGLLDQARNDASEKRVEQAVAELEAATRLAPQSPWPHLELARLYAIAQAERALKELDLAVVNGYCEPDLISHDESLALLSQHEMFSRIIDSAAAAQKKWIAEWKSVHHEVDASKARRFASAEALAQYFGSERERADSTAWQFSDPDVVRRRWRLLDLEIASIRLYLSEHPHATDRESAAARMVDAFFEYKDPNPIQYWADDGPVVVSAVDAFLHEFPGSPKTADMEFRRALAHWLSRPFPSDPRRSRELDPVATAEALDSFDRVAQRFPGTVAAGRAAFVTTVLCYYRDGQRITKDVRTRYATFLSEWGGDPIQQKYATSIATNMLVELADWSEFSVQDTAGRSWSTRSTAGKVLLIEFWATWCAPCVADIPKIRTLQQAYGSQGLEIIGINLDEGPGFDLQKWTNQHGVTWPQVHDGKGLHSPIAFRYRIGELPTRVLVDRSGRARVIVGGNSSVEDIVARAVQDHVGASVESDLRK